MAFKLILPYEHDSADLRPIHIAASRRAPVDADWHPALRDTVGGRRVVWARLPQAPIPGMTFWIRHGDVATQVKP